jgi:hypothetical protein
MPGSVDPLDAGTINTAVGDLRLGTQAGELVGISSVVRTVVGDETLAPGPRAVRAMVNLVFEFGGPDEFYDDTITVTSLIKPFAGSQAPPLDYDGQITGGSGRFLGATGRMRVLDTVFNDDLTILSTKLRFEAYVPVNFPRPAAAGR